MRACVRECMLFVKGRESLVHKWEPNTLSRPLSRSKSTLKTISSNFGVIPKFLLMPNRFKEKDGTDPKPSGEHHIHHGRCFLQDAEDTCTLCSHFVRFATSFRSD